MKKRLLTIIIAFSASFVLVVILSLFSLARFDAYTTYTAQVEHTSQVITSLYRVEVSLKDLDRTERGYTATHDTSLIRIFDSAVDSLSPALALLESLSKDNQPQARNVTHLKTNVALRIKYGRQNIDYIDTSLTFVPSVYYFEGRKVMREATAIIRAMQNLEKEMLNERFKNQKNYQQLTTRSLIYLFVLFCVLTILLFILLSRALQGRLRYQRELQARLTELDRSHSELQEIAYAASHDLQEPLRKIQVFSNMLNRQGDVPEGAKDKLGRIGAAAEQLQELISALMSLTMLNKTNEELSDVNLNEVLNRVVAELEEEILLKKAIIEIRPLPVIKGYRKQLGMLFKALLDNSLKFSREGVIPRVTVFYDPTDGSELAEINPTFTDKKYHRITCEDNGIGFENKFSERMFRLYQTLHTPTDGYEGLGTGLSISRRIMTNHDGFIIARGAPNQGAKFKLFFPIQDQ